MSVYRIVYVIVYVCMCVCVYVCMCLCVYVISMDSGGEWWLYVALFLVVKKIFLKVFPLCALIHRCFR